MCDVWHSADGVEWTMATHEPAWIHCKLPITLVYQNRMWVFGGGNYDPIYLGYNDVWC